MWYLYHKNIFNCTVCLPVCSANLQNDCTDFNGSFPGIYIGTFILVRVPRKKRNDQNRDGKGHTGDQEWWLTRSIMSCLEKRSQIYKNRRTRIKRAPNEVEQPTVVSTDHDVWQLILSVNPTGTRREDVNK